MLHLQEAQGARLLCLIEWMLPVAGEKCRTRLCA